LRAKLGLNAESAHFARLFASSNVGLPYGVLDFSLPEAGKPFNFGEVISDFRLESGAFLQDLAVDPDFQKNGIGTELRNKGLRFVQCDTTSRRELWRGDFSIASDLRALHVQYRCPAAGAGV
jgi:GNAT superfamily N-acetyltransferase